MKKVFAVAVLSAAVLVASAAPAFAQRYPPPRFPTCNVSDHTPEPGQTVLVGGKFWKPNTTLTVGFHQKRTDTVVLKTATTGDDDQWQTTITVPETVVNAPAAFGAIGKDKSGKRFRCIIPVDITGAGGPRYPTSASEPAGITTGMASLAVAGLFGAHLMIRHRRRVKKLVG